MTNTRMTDPEILERRYPVILRQFGIRNGSGGLGAYRGGDGVVRELEFTESMHVSILSDRRVHRPYGLEGGKPGASGLNLWKRRDGVQMNCGGKNSMKLEAGDCLVISTPGGGGYGRAASVQDE
jgi:5-oxoprolinase (ATP-hydrolysing)